MAPRTSSVAVSDPVWQCVSPFVVFKGRVPDVYGADRMVSGSDPILKTHRQYFAPVADRVQEQTQIMAAASPLSSPVPFTLKEQENTDG